MTSRQADDGYGCDDPDGRSAPEDDGDQSQLLRPNDVRKAHFQATTALDRLPRRRQSGCKGSLGRGQRSIRYAWRHSQLGGRGDRGSVPIVVGVPYSGLHCIRVDPSRFLVKPKRRVDDLRHVQRHLRCDLPDGRGLFGHRAKKLLLARLPIVDEALLLLAPRASIDSSVGSRLRS
jgi:hypothetical protein